MKSFYQFEIDNGDTIGLEKFHVIQDQISLAHAGVRRALILVVDLGQCTDWLSALRAYTPGIIQYYVNLCTYYVSLGAAAVVHMPQCSWQVAMAGSSSSAYLA